MARHYRPSKIVRDVSIMESNELYENFCFYLINEGYTDTLGGAEIIIANMSSLWKNNIINEILSTTSSTTPPTTTNIPIKPGQDKQNTKNQWPSRRIGGGTR